jgi:hypothetical protein
MFSQPVPEVSANNVIEEKKTPYIPGYNASHAGPANTMTAGSLDTLLEKEKQHNKTEPWNKLDKTAKIAKLHNFAEKYGKEKGLPVKEIKGLQQFFSECLDKGKLQKTKDVVYDRDTHMLTAIPALHFNSEKRHFTLRIVDVKRVSTLKSLTPKRLAIEEA